MNKNPVVSISLKLDELNYVLQALAARPFIEVQELIANLQKQGQAGVVAANPADPPQDDVE